jgi:tetratricopeptide (TPR) repeat protein
MLKRMLVGLVLVAATASLRAQDATPDEPPVDNDHSPFHVALLAFKSGHYGEARTAIDEAEKAKPGDPAVEIFKSRILTETGDFAGAKAALETLNNESGLTPRIKDAQTMAFGDMNLRKRSFDEAAKSYESLLAHKPGDSDLILKIVYTRVGASDLVSAGQYASQLKPLDLKNPYDDHASYYFAKAALAQATGNTEEAESQIQNARTNYGTTVTNRYLKTYLELFAPSAKTDATFAPAVKPAPSGVRP